MHQFTKKADHQDIVEICWKWR